MKLGPQLVIAAHKLGFVMANAGIDESNISHEDGAERVLLLPRDPDGSAAELKRRLDATFGVSVAVIINDSFGRPWRNGVVGVALGAAGLPSLVDRRGAPDLFGRKLRVTEIAVADELASAASLLMGQAAEALPGRTRPRASLRSACAPCRGARARARKGSVPMTDPRAAFSGEGRVVALCGGVGGAKLAAGLARVAGREAVVIVNTADDFEHLGLAISPDIDTVLYTLGGRADKERGWGRADESWRFLSALGELGGETWFQLGDRDLALHVLRTEALRAGRTLTAIVGEVARRFGHSLNDPADVGRSDPHHRRDAGGRPCLPALFRRAPLRP